MKNINLNRVNLAFLPTPLHPLPNLSRLLGGPRLFMKRDDLTGTAFGGTKERALEFIMADAVAAGAEVVITSGKLQTNQGRLACGIARRLGMQPVLVLAGDEPSSYHGNLLLDHLAGAHLHFVPRGVGPTPEAAMDNENAITNRKVEELKDYHEARGHRVFVVPKGGATAIGVVGYVRAARELACQAEAAGLAFDAVVVASGGGGTQAGLHLGLALYAPRTAVVGISVASGVRRLVERVQHWSEATRELMGYPPLTLPNPQVEDGYVGAGFPIPSAASIETANLLARAEGIYVDFVYAGKALAGLVDLVHRKRWPPDATVLFWHTGGVPGLFAQAADLDPVTLHLARSSASACPGCS